MVGGNLRAARLVGLPANALIVTACALGGAAAGLAGGIPLAVIPVAVLFGGFLAAGSLLQRRMGLPDASVQVLLGFTFVLILAAEALRGRLFPVFSGRAPAAAGSAVRLGSAA